MKNNPASYEEIYNAFKYLSEKLHEFDEVPDGLHCLALHKELRGERQTRCGKLGP